MTAKLRLKWSFFKLLHELPLNRISIMLLCEKANVNRQTFYYYYQNLIDLLKEVLFEEIYDEIMQKGSAYETWKHGFLTTTRFIKKHNNLFLNIYYSAYWEEINQFFTTKANDLLRKVIEECLHKQKLSVSTEDQEYMIRFYRILIYGVITEWAKDGMSLSPEELLTKLAKMLDGSIPRALERFANDDSRQIIQ